MLWDAGKLTREMMAKFQNPITATPLYLPHIINGKKICTLGFPRVISHLSFLLTFFLSFSMLVKSFFLSFFLNGKGSDVAALKEFFNSVC